MNCYNDQIDYENTTIVCMTCGKGDEELIDYMFCSDCWKRQQFLQIFNESSTYRLGSYFGKHLFEKYLGYYVSENSFIAFMLVRGYKFNERTRTFKVKINKKKALEILGIKV